MQKLVEGLHKFKSEIFNNNEALFKPLVSGQQPEVLFITCSDSRVAPNLITQTNPGDLFIMRNAGNIVPSYGLAVGGEAATIEFAVLGLGVKHIVICGHTQCGAMKALLNPKMLDDAPAMRAWLGHAEATRRVIDENYAHIEGPGRLTVTVEENVLTQIEQLRTHPAVRSRLARGELSLHGWVYKLETGEVFQYNAEDGQFVGLTTSMSPVPPALRARSL
ncbi:Carbonic anhydrase [Minicystis rosea]|nr:Carbonic anhydrase [Minicystis rosea]